jgi:hypothetical protein
MVQTLLPLAKKFANSEGSLLEAIRILPLAKWNAAAWWQASESDQEKVDGVGRTV